MSDRQFVHSPHGDALHNIAIMIGKSICAERGYHFLPHRALQDKSIYPGIPDIYIRRDDRTHSGARIIHRQDHFIIEIESKTTNASIQLKARQFSSDDLTELIIIDLRKLRNSDVWRNVTLGDLVDFMEEWIP